MNSDMLRAVADTLRNGNLPTDEESQGFFFGTPEIWSEYREEADEHAEVFERAAKWLDEDPWRTVEYCASW
jgi:hypothetical protein